MSRPHLSMIEGDETRPYPLRAYLRQPHLFVVAQRDDWFSDTAHFVCLAQFFYSVALSVIHIVSIVVFYYYFSALLCICVVLVEVSNCVDLIESSTGRYCLVILWARINAR